jgi:1-acyl-sn-glycerol-3-phosphate acyltransferase
MKELREFTATAWPFAGRLFSFKWVNLGKSQNRWRPLHPLVCWLIRLLTRVLCRIDLDALAEVPMEGPLILVGNHIGSIEVPLLYAHLQPRRVIGLAKIETWDSRFMAWLFDLFEAIPIRRGEADLEAMRRSLGVLTAGDILAITPEGTRSWNGKLLRGQPGIVTLALRSGAPLLPVAHWGVEKFSKNIEHLRRTDFHIRVGQPFYLKDSGERVTSEVRQQMADEIMSQVAALLPEAYRGEYADSDPPSQKYLLFCSEILCDAQHKKH